MLTVMQYQPEHTIAFDLKNGQLMVNATQMAKPFGKQPTHFLRLEATSQYIEALKKRYANSHSGNYDTQSDRVAIPQLVQVVNGDNGGTWLHQKLALRFAQWLSPEFAIWVDEKIEELVTTGRTEIKPVVPTTYKEALIHLLQLEEAREALTAQNAAMQPKADFYDAVVQTQDTFTIGEVAKVLNIQGFGPNRLFQFLREKGILMHSNAPYQRYVDAGWFRCIEGMYTDKYNVDRVYRKTVVFQKGVDGIRKLLSNDGYQGATTKAVLNF